MTNEKHLAFAGSLIAGGVLVILASLAGFKAASLIIGALAIFVHWGLTRDERDEESADASYFLGFLLTLVLLAAGLWDLGQDVRPGSTANVLPFLYDLAYGLMLTVVGLAVRQVRVLGTIPTLLAPDEALRKELGALIAAQKDLATSIVSLASRLDGSVLGETVRRTDSALSKAQEAASMLGMRIAASTSSMESAIEKLEKSVTGTAIRLEVSTGKSLGDMERHVELATSKIGAVLETIEQQREQVAASLRRSTEEAERTQREIGSEINEQLAEWKRSLDTTHGTLVALHAGIEDEYGRGMKAVGLATQSFTRLSQQVVEQVEGLPNPSERLAQLWHGIQRLDELLARSAREASGRLIELGDSSVKARDAIGSLASSAGASAQQIRAGGQQAGAALETELGQIRRILDEFHNALEHRVGRIGAR